MSRLFEPCQKVPVHRRTKPDSFALAFHDHAQPRRLNPSGGQAVGDLFPDQRRQGVPVQTIEDPASLLRPDQLQVDAAVIVQRVFDRLLGDFVEHHPAHRHLRFQDFEEVPGDALSLAVFISGQVENLGFL